MRPVKVQKTRLTTAHNEGYDHILRAQEEEEEERLKARLDQIWRDSQLHSYIEDNKTTPWLKHTKWPKLFRNRPLEIIAVSTRPPAEPRDDQNKDYILGAWQGAQLRSPGAAERRLRLLIWAIEDMFDQVEATLLHTSYRSRYWLTSYYQKIFWNRLL